ncbi:GNAT family N-acetyltransferase [Rhizobium lentis]|uniref:Putative acetyltransferase n=1 Tax=Rhizobium lentis TaxID=1138194 RepID=A0A7W8UJR8_9HYPH|nr:GNAT family N-acetyltransferase [Rhizobium lentis]MBB4572610.1 putative acetyltransferase [Rhizobium lentis]MBB5548201.1 putative acetyltransferase [Rhizobium lentis]MBB5558729.1 putative acetyltransferase [Rhizobium lentis]MBB5565747.1 putative acetyltransferase [Rhizobium lentis]
MTVKATAEAAGRVVLLSPDLDNLSGFETALAAGWSPDPRRAGDETFIMGELRRLRRDRSRFLNALNPDPKRAVRLGRESLSTQLFWIWDGEFCGSIGLRFIPGTEELPPEVSGHVGYSVVPWKQGNGHATRALRLLLAVAEKHGLAGLIILCNEDNDASRRVIERNGGELFKRGSHPSDRPDRTKLYFRLRPAPAD